ncbi:MAG: PspC domain-containing protein [Actinobacteria bacterium]|nr:PspC domain-containing protein [Actinomycetota bacterium]
MDAGPLTFQRSDDGRVVAGVAAGFSRRHGVDPMVVRGALVVLTFAAGLGLVIYALGASLSVAAPMPGQPAAPSAPVDTRRNVSVALVALGLMLVVRSTGLWLGDAVMLPLTVLAAGVVVLGLVRTEDDRATRLSELMSGRHARARILLGAGLLVLGLVAVGTTDSVSGTLRVSVFAAAVSIVGVALLLGPWITRLAQSAAEERRDRIRAEEREAMAAHLHDSVLQTLALIQRNADDPRRTASLARQQEHELRAWLFGDTGPAGATLTGAMQATAREVEQRYDVRIDLVMVGDAPLDDEGAALVAATREACVNAAQHSGDTSVSVYVEVAADNIEAFVRDRGRGFDRAATVPDRHGIAQSIEARIDRVGGVAEIDSTPGEGTEVHLRVPRRTTADPKVTS